MKLLFTLLFSISVSGCTYLLTPKVEDNFFDLRKGQYQLDPKHTSVVFKVSHMQLSTYVGRFNRMDATLDFDPQHPEATRLEAWVDASSVDVNNESLEQKLKGNWFKSKQYPKIILKTLSALPTKHVNQFEFQVELTLLGVTKHIPLTATFHGGASNWLTGYYTLGFSALIEIKRSDFGMDQYIPLVGDDVTIEIYAEFQKQ